MMRTVLATTPSRKRKSSRARGSLAESNRRIDAQIGRLEREAHTQAGSRFSGKRNQDLLKRLEAGIRQANRNAAAVKRLLKAA